jgi:hypothetical protein
VGPETGALLDEAHDKGLTVSLGFWLGHERHGFDYGDPEQVAEQLSRAQEAVLTYKDHPAVLLWGIGNEMEGFTSGDDPDVWRAVCEVAEMVQTLDPHHPVMTTTAELGGGRIDAVMGCSHIDIHGVNAYGGGASVGERYRAAGGTKPLVLTEYGPPGIWEIPATSYGAYPELTSTAKADVYRAVATSIRDEPQMLGGYAFLWGWKTEATATWYGLFLSDETRLGGVDALAEVWGGAVDAAAPQVTPLVVEGGDTVAKGARVRVSWEARDPEGQPLETTWTLRREVVEQSTGGDPQGLPPAIDAVVSSDAQHAVVQMPKSHGVYRLYAVTKDPGGAGAAASVPILVDRPMTEDEPLPMPWWVYQDDGIGGPWVPSGWMGDIERLQVDTGWTEDCHGPPTCVRVVAPPSAWTGVAWQSPANNWGEHPGGQDLSRARFVTFWARADGTDVPVTFGVGLLEEGTYVDSMKLEKVVRLGFDWKRVRIRLRGDRSHLITGFWWGTTTDARGATFYVDDVRFE